jgi:hypothetical protein
MTIFLLLVCLLVLVFNTALLLAICGVMVRTLEPTEVPKTKPNFVSDRPVPRPPNYSDMILTQSPPEELKIIKDA